MASSTKLPQSLQAYVQLCLLNLGFLIVLIKEINILCAFFSFLFIFILVSLANHHLLHRGKTEPEQNYFTILNESVNDKIKNIRADLHECLVETQKKHQSKKQSYFLAMLVVVYFCMTFLYDWMEALVFLNFTFIYFFLPEIFEKARNFICNVYNKKCPFAAKN